MDRASIYFVDDSQQKTYDFDEELPPLPLPDLHDTMLRYYESVKPFGKEEELAMTRNSIEIFEKGIGAELHGKLMKRAEKMKNWLDEWWDAYAYHMLRLPLNPYIVMAMPTKLNVIGRSETPEMALKNFARFAYHTIEFWDLLHKAAIKPLSSNDGKIKYSSALYKRFFSTSRIPGLEIDHIESHFKTIKDGKTPSHAMVSGKGRIFMFDCLDESDGSILTPQEILIVLQRIRSIIDYEPLGDCVPILTHDDRTCWALNRTRLLELSLNNKDHLKLIESANIVLVFDENEPQDYAEISQVAIYGDYHSKWGDRSSTLICYKNGKFACVGEHSCYDGTISVSYILFIQLSLIEVPEPDWTDCESMALVPIKEVKFDLNDTIRSEIERVKQVCDDRRSDVLVTHELFQDYGKDYIKSCKLHPDSFIQVIMQLAYNEMHKEIASTYETALMRHYYNGRTETLRSCTSEVYKFIQIASNTKSTKAEIVNAFRKAVNHHNYMMNEARKGHGVDRHLFGLWCTAYENKIDIPDFFSDPLYLKSGGGGNFILSSSTLGYSVNVGFVAPMVVDGYGIFYSITGQHIFLQTSAFRDSQKTSAHKLNQFLINAFRKIKSLLDENRTRLLELSLNNKDHLKLIESANIVLVFDENEPQDYAEISQVAIYGDYHSKWGDRSSTLICYKNGKFACVGEHSCYDGTISVSYILFIQLSLIEVPEPDWTDCESMALVPIKEVKFDLNDTIRSEIERVKQVCDDRRSDVLVTHELFQDYGKDYIKSCKLHPDSFIQVIMQLAYNEMHKEIASTYETALMRHYYNGRTETLRSCTSEVYKFIQIASNTKSTKAEIVNAFRKAVNHHNYMMNEARKGHGVDRHLFGLWCTAYENKIDIPDFFSDPLYLKSGGGGNFILSSSTLGYSVNVGFVAPMVVDGYGIFYSITGQHIFLQTSAFRDSQKTSAHKLNQFLINAFRKIKSLLDEVTDSKL